jgi:hypothetical protein
MVSVLICLFFQVRRHCKTRELSNSSRIKGRIYILLGPGTIFRRGVIRSLFKGRLLFQDAGILQQLIRQFFKTHSPRKRFKKTLAMHSNHLTSLLAQDFPCPPTDKKYAIHGEFSSAGECCTSLICRMSVSASCIVTCSTKPRLVLLERKYAFLNGWSSFGSPINSSTLSADSYAIHAVIL